MARRLRGALRRSLEQDALPSAGNSREPEQGLGHFFWWVSQVCLQEGFEERSDKRRVLRPSQQQRVTGVVTNASPSVPREERRRLRAVLHNCRTHGVESQARGRPRFREYLLGYAAYVAMVNPQHGEPLLAQARALFSAG